MTYKNTTVGAIRIEALARLREVDGSSAANSSKDNSEDRESDHVGGFVLVSMPVLSWV